jgi:hypothetical protein
VGQVKPSGRDIGADQEPGLRIAELLVPILALLLRHVAVQPRDRELPQGCRL